MLDLLQTDFFFHAMIISVLLSTLFGFISFFIVLRKMAFMGAGISHTAFGGVALGIVLGLDPFFTSLVFCIAAALLISRLSKQADITYDTAIGIFFSFSMALGGILISLRKDYSFDLMGYLFGNILAVQTKDTMITLILLMIFIPFMILFQKKILFFSFDEEVAKISGVAVNKLDSVLLIFLAAIIVVSIKAVGIILVSALIVLPASFGLLVSKKYQWVIFAGIVFILFSMVSGLLVSFMLDTPTGATIVSLATVYYFLSLGFQKARS